MNDPSSDCQLNQNEVDYCFESNEVPEFLCNVYEKFVPKLHSTKVQCTNKKDNEIKNQLITCSREEKWKSKIFSTKKTNPSTGLNYIARTYIHILKDIGVCIILKVVLHLSHPCYPNQAEMLKQHRELSMSVHCIIENNEEAEIRPSKTYQSFVATAGGHHELNFIEKDLTREV
ncbi:hypothetical protein Ahy_A08g039865 [Arachis hypogaea]|uniref:FAR1 domain-containing protein n=1 Tax=Arachis hypogaea TaxID=3818 RepID=A0A445BXL4_ARAHY|nr:hypothetical protein Ahy_A08g039865 [Arachis hypogaea]